MRRKYRCWLPCVGLCASVPTLGTRLLKCLIPWCQPPVAPGGHLPLHGTLTWQNSISKSLMPSQRSQCKGRQENELLESEGTNALSQGPPTHCCALLPISSLVNAKSTLPHPPAQTLHTVSLLGLSPCTAWKLYNALWDRSSSRAP